jgi:hypothetical protein
MLEVTTDGGLIGGERRHIRGLAVAAVTLARGETSPSAPSSLD